MITMMKSQIVPVSGVVRSVHNMITINNARIVDIGKEDAYYENKEAYIGKIGIFYVHKQGHEFCEGRFEVDGYSSGHLYFIEVKIAHEESPVIKKTNHPIVADNFETGRKEDSGKLRMDLITPEALEALAKVLGYGANKYGDWNWSKGIVYSRVIAAVLRHINSWRKLEDNDPETGLNHLSHAFCGLMFLITYITRRMSQFDDRTEGNKHANTVTEKTYCYDCGTDLEPAGSNTLLNSGIAFSPCKSCIKVSYDSGYDKCMEDSI